jgi:putative transposase
MGDSYCNLLYHIVFSTKARAPLLKPELLTPLNGYIGGIVHRLNGMLILANGTHDHIHLLVRLKQQPAVADVVRDIKSGSSGWVHREHPECEGFEWQDGYGAFTVSPSQLDRVREYILRQSEHHRSRDFRAELLALLKAHGIEFDERYICR